MQRIVGFILIVVLLTIGLIYRNSKTQNEDISAEPTSQRKGLSSNLAKDSNDQKQTRPQPSKTAKNPTQAEQENSASSMPERSLSFPDSKQTYLPAPKRLISFKESLGTKWLLVPSLRSFPLSSFSDQKNILLKISGYGLVESDNAPMLSSGAVVYESRQQRYGVVTGTIIVQLQEWSNDLLNSGQWTVVDSLPDIKMVMLQPMDQELSAALNSLRANPLVKEAEVEILSQQLRKR